MVISAELFRADAMLVLMARRSFSGRFRGIDERDEDPETDPRDSAESPESPGSGHLVMVHVDESALRGKGGASDLPIRTVKRPLCEGPAVGIVEDGADGDPQGARRAGQGLPLSGMHAHPVAGCASHQALD